MNGTVLPSVVVVVATSAGSVVAGLYDCRHDVAGVIGPGVGVELESDDVAPQGAFFEDLLGACPLLREANGSTLLNLLDREPGFLEVVVDEGGAPGEAYPANVRGALPLEPVHPRASVVEADLAHPDESLGRTKGKLTI